MSVLRGVRSRTLSAFHTHTHWTTRRARRTSGSTATTRRSSRPSKSPRRRRRQHHQAVAQPLMRPNAWRVRGCARAVERHPVA
eukprot:170629-Prymnesium_polylepis.1